MKTVKLASTKYLDSLPAGGNFDDLAQVLYDQARLNESGQLEQPGEFSRRLNSLLVRLAAVP